MESIILDFSFGEGLSFFFHFGIDFVKIVVEVLENHVELLRNQKNFFQFDDVAVVQFSQRFNLPQLDAFVPTRILLLHLLDRHHLSRLDIGCLIHCPEGTISQGLYRLILLHIESLITLLPIKAIDPNILIIDLSVIPDFP